MKMMHLYTTLRTLFQCKTPPGNLVTLSITLFQQQYFIMGNIIKTVQATRQVAVRTLEARYLPSSETIWNLQKNVSAQPSCVTPTVTKWTQVNKVKPLNFSSYLQWNITGQTSVIKTKSNSCPKANGRLQGHHRQIDNLFLQFQVFHFPQFSIEG